MDDHELNVLVAKVLGWTLLLVGVLGFIPPLVWDEALLGIFGINLLHNLVHLATGGALLAGAYLAEGSKAPETNLTLGVIYGLVALLGFMGIIVPTLLNSEADNVLYADELLHLALTLVLLGAAAKALMDAEGTASGM